MTMSNNSSDSESRSLEGAENADEARKDGLELPLAPAISSYFEKAPVSPQTLFQALKAGKVERFTQADEARAVALADENDRDGERLWALLSQAKLPACCENWIWNATRLRLEARLGGEVGLFEVEPAQVLKSIVGREATHLTNAPKGRAGKLSCWVRIAICWLIEKRHLAPIQIGEHLREPLFRSKGDVAKTVTNALKRGRSVEFRCTLAMVLLGEAEAKAAQDARYAEWSKAQTLRRELEEARDLLAAQQAEQEKTKAEAAALSEQLEAVQRALEAERQHSGHDLAEAKGGQQVFLQQRIAPLLSDAVDALEISRPDVALRRLVALRELIEEAKE